MLIVTGWFLNACLCVVYGVEHFASFCHVIRKCCEWWALKCTSCSRCCVAARAWKLRDEPGYNFVSKGIEFNDILRVVCIMKAIADAASNVFYFILVCFLPLKLWKTERHKRTRIDEVSNLVFSRWTLQSTKLRSTSSTRKKKFPPRDASNECFAKLML